MYNYINNNYIIFICICTIMININCIFILHNTIIDIKKVDKQLNVVYDTI